jgi:hypothetical protein
MKKNLLFALALLLSTISYAQTPNGFVGLGNTDPKAKLHITSDTSGLLIPKYATLALANSNSLPKLNATDHKGLMIYVDEAANQGFWYYNGNAFVKVGGAGGFFKVSAADANHIIYSDAINYGKNFIINGDSINYKTGTEFKLFLNSSKSAFRVGAVDNKNWDKDSIGQYSFASGYGTKASEYAATAMGGSTTASRWFSTAMGGSTKASGNYSTAMGSSSTASGPSSTAMGNGTTASERSSTAMGENTTASGWYSTAMGSYSTASGYSATAMGSYSTASGYSSTAMGDKTTALGTYSTAMGTGTKAKTLAETVIGAYNDTLAVGSATANSYAGDSSRIFTVGNGTGGSGIRKTAFVIQINGNVGVGERKPTSTLQVKGSFAENITTTTATAYTFLDTDATVLDDNSGTTAVTFTLPDPTKCLGRKVTIKKINTASHVITIKCTNGSGTITVESSNGSGGYSVSALSSLASYTLQSDGAKWWVIGKF